MNNSKSQAAMEFIMNYGWAFLIVLIVIFSLVYFGLLNPNIFVPDKVELVPGLEVIDAGVDQDSLSFILVNNLGKDVHEFIVNATRCNNSNGAVSAPIQIPAGKTITVRLYCGSTSSVGDKFSTTLKTSYKTKTKGELFDHSGNGMFRIGVSRGNETYADKPYTTQALSAACTTLNESYVTYKLSSDIEDNTLTDDCIKIAAQKVEIDCDGHYIKSDKAFSGVYSSYDYTGVKNCNISMNTSLGGIGIELSNANHAYISNNTISGQDYGIYTYQTSESNITNNSVRSNSNTGIYLRYSSDNRVSNNIVESNKDGIYLYWPSNNNIISNNIIKYNTYLFSGGTGIKLSMTPESNTITDNTIESNNYGIYLSRSKDNIISGNNLSNNSRGNIFIEMDIGYFNNTIDLTNIIDSSFRIYYNTYVSDEVFNAEDLEDISTFYCINCDNLIIRNVIMNKKDSHAFFLYNLTNSQLSNLTVSNYTTGIYLKSADNNNISQITSSSNEGTGIMIEDSTNNNLIDITTNSNNASGMYITSNSNNNNFTNITANSNVNYGIYLKSNNNNFSNITTNSNQYGLHLYSGSNNNTFRNITADSNSLMGIFLWGSMSNTNNNSFYDFSITNCASENTSWQNGSLLVYASSNNHFENGYIGNSGKVGLHVRTYGNQAENNTFKDIIIENTILWSDVFVNEYHNFGSNMNNSFINVSYDDAKEEVIYTSELIRKWYYKTKVEYSSTPVDGAAVKIYDKDTTLRHTLATDATGYTPAAGISEYRNYRGTRTYYSYYKINATNTTYSGEHTNYNATSNNMSDLIVIS